MYDEICDRCGDDLPVGHPDWTPAWDLNASDGGAAPICRRCLTGEERQQLDTFDVEFPGDGEDLDIAVDEVRQWAR
jgi:hypothetical protein